MQKDYGLHKVWVYCQLIYWTTLKIFRRSSCNTKFLYRIKYLCVFHLKGKYIRGKMFFRVKKNTHYSQDFYLFISCLDTPYTNQSNGWHIYSKRWNNGCFCPYGLCLHLLYFRRDGEYMLIQKRCKYNFIADWIKSDFIKVLSLKTTKLLLNKLYVYIL